MLKLLGCLLVFSSSIGFACRICTDMRNHLRLLYDIRKLLSDIANETAYSMDSMEAVLKYDVQSKNPYLDKICKETGKKLEKKENGCGQELWRESIEACQNELGLTSDEKEIFIEAGAAFFGKSIHENSKGLEHYMERLDYVIDQVRNEQKEKQKVYRTASVMCGLIVILLFL